MQSVIVSSRHTEGSIWLYARGICVSLGLTIVACAPCTFIIIIIIITYYYYYYYLLLSLLLIIIIIVFTCAFMKDEKHQGNAKGKTHAI